MWHILLTIFQIIVYAWAAFCAIMLWVVRDAIRDEWRKSNNKPRW